MFLFKFINDIVIVDRRLLYCTRVRHACLLVDFVSYSLFSLSHTHTPLLFFSLLVSTAATAAAIVGDGQRGRERGRGTVSALLVQPAGGDLRDAAGVPVLRLLGVVVG